MTGSPDSPATIASASARADTAASTDEGIPTLPGRVQTSLRFVYLLITLVGLLGIFSVLASIAPDFAFVAVAPEADHVINTGATLIAAAVAALAWIRYRETGQLDTIFQAAAFMVLSIGGAVLLLLLVTGEDAALGFDRRDPGQAPLYVWTALRLVAAPLLLAGALTALRPTAWRLPRRRRATAVAVLAPTAVVLVAIALILSLLDVLPELVPVATLQTIVQTPATRAASLINPPMLFTQLAIAAVFLLAALCYGLAYGRSRGDRPYHAYLAVGLVVAGFSQIHFGIVPGAYSDVLTVSDVLRMAFYTLVGVGVGAAARHDLVELREANQTLRRLRSADQQRIALEERARLAREVHDGLVQDLWLARLTHGRLVQALGKASGVPADAREAARRVDGILEDALAEARQAVVSLQPHDDASFGSLLVRFVEDYGDRFGLEVDVELEGEPITLTGQQQAEVLRICREALNNARKHADPSLVTVTLRNEPPLLRLTIADNGKGFDSGKAQRGFGLKGMMARALDIGARLHVDSQPLGGTRVVLELPRPAPRSGAAP